MTNPNNREDASPAVAVLADDPVTRDAVAAYLAAAPRVRLLPDGRIPEADVVVVIAGLVTGRTLSGMSAVARATSGRARVVLVADAISEPQIALAVGHGMSAFLTRAHAELDQILTAAVESHGVRPMLPPRMTAALLDRMRAMNHGAASADLTPREVGVLQLLADGLSTVEIATKLNYSERLIKSVIQSLVKRLGLRNRTHAVAYAIRMGVL